jgi:hypothetical protein
MLETGITQSRDSSVDVATGYRLDDRVIGFRYPAGARNFSLRQYVQTGSGTHQASCPMGTGACFPESKVAGM